MGKVTDILAKTDRVQADDWTQRDLEIFWAHCSDVMDWHRTQVKLGEGETDIPLWNKLMCVAYCAATWNDWKEGYPTRLEAAFKDDALRRCKEEMGAARKEIARLMARLRRAEKAQKGGGA